MVAVSEAVARLQIRHGIDAFKCATLAELEMVLAAGGRIVTLDGEPLSYNRKASFLNPEFLVIADDAVDWLAAFAAS